MIKYVDGLRGRIVVVGDLFADAVIDARRISRRAGGRLDVSSDAVWFGPGGAGTVARGCLGPGIVVDLFGLVGDDPLGRMITVELHKLGVGVAGVRAGQTGTMSRQYLYLENGLGCSVAGGGSVLGEELSESWWSLEADDPADVLVIADFAKTPLPECFESECRFMVISTKRPFELVGRLPPNAILITGRADVRGAGLSDETIYRRLKLSFPKVIFTRESDMVWASFDSQRLGLDPPSCTGTFTIGAGDWLTGRFASGLAAGFDRESALVAAVRSAAESLSVPQTGGRL